VAAPESGKTAARPGMLSLDGLRGAVDAGTIDTVVLAFTDMQGRLQGKRVSAEFFLDEVVSHHAEGCNYLLAVDIDMNTVDGYEMSSWERGYGDFVLMPDFETLRHLPWHEASAQAMAYQDLTPVNLYNVDYSILGTGRVEPLMRRIRLGMSGAGMYVESSKGECNLGQHEIAFRYADALTTCDNHSIYKTGAKEIAAQDGMSLTFMAKPNAREGNSCHVHLSLRDSAGRPVLAGDGPFGLSPAGEHFLAGQLAGLSELILFHAPNVNSYKRYVPGSFAPTAVRWGVDNRTCAYRLVGHGHSLRPENRVPGGDVNPYLAIAAMIAAGLEGIENEMPLEPPMAGNAYSGPGPRVPSTLRDALEAWEHSQLARKAFGSDVVEHYANGAKVELAAFDAAVTDWELQRGFERT